MSNLPRAKRSLSRSSNQRTSAIAAATPAAFGADLVITRAASVAAVSLKAYISSKHKQARCYYPAAVSCILFVVN